MTKLHHCLLLIISLCSTSFIGHSQSTTSGKSELNTQARNLNNFTKISLNVPGTLTVSQANEYSFRVEARQEILDQLVTEIKDSELIIKFKDDKWKMPRESTIRVFAALPKLKGIEINGSGSMIAQTDITTDNLYLELNGSGDITMKKVTASDLEVEINGSGSMGDISGAVNSISMEVNGSGDIQADNLNARTVSASIAGSGNISIGNAETVEANIAGSGDIFYKGNPANVQKNIAGSGKVSQR